MSGYPCITKHSFMLNVPCRGSMDDPESRYKGNKAAFMQHNQLALAKQAFAKYFLSPHAGWNIADSCEKHIDVF
jgi:hypothetical protein